MEKPIAIIKTCFIGGLIVSIYLILLNLFGLTFYFIGDYIAKILMEKNLEEAERFATIMGLGGVLIYLYITSKIFK